MKASLSTSSCWPKSLAAALLLVPFSAQGSGTTFASDVLFRPGSAVVTREYQLRIQELACRVEQRRHEVVIAIGHTDNKERAAKQLALARARNALVAVAAAGIQSPGGGWAEGKGAMQPVADNNTPEGRARNRRVEIEMISYRTPESDALRWDRCVPAWRAQLLSLSGREALAFARSQVREGWVGPETLMQAVIAAGRVDLFQTFWPARAGLALDKTQRRMVFMQVLGAGNLPMIEAALDAGWPLLKSPREPLAHVLCGSGTTAPVVRLLIARGARPSPPPPGQLPLLACAVPQKGLEVVQLLLKAGADPREVQGVVALASTNREMISLLLAAGADPLDKLPKSYGGGTLFHVMTLREPADIQWLQSLGLDINEKDAYGHTPLANQLPRLDERLLEALVSAGSNLDEPEYGLLGAARDNVAARLWLLQRGASLSRSPALLASWVREGERALPVMEAYRARGGDVNAKDRRGHTALAAAISSLKPDMVAFLLRAGADQLQVAPGLSAQAMAAAVDARPVRSPCPSTGCTTAAPSDTVDTNRLAAKNEVLRLLEDATSPR